MARSLPDEREDGNGRSARSRVLLVLGGAAGVAGLAASAVLVDRLPAEGGAGMAVRAATAASATASSALGGSPHFPSAVPAPAAAAAPVPAPGLIATLRAATPWSASAGGPVAGEVPATNPFGSATVLAVTGRATVGAAGWLHVELPVRPNGSAGWIPAAAVALTETPYRVTVHLAARTLTVTDAGRPVLTTPVAVGAPATPTPPDSTYLWELIRPDDPNGAYGPYIFGLAEFSDAYSTFNGGDAQIGIHGQDEPWSIGQAASHGCVRVPNDVITRLAGMLPLGTPVDIS